MYEYKRAAGCFWVPQLRARKSKDNIGKIQT